MAKQSLCYVGTAWDVDQVGNELYVLAGQDPTSHVATVVTDGYTTEMVAANAAILGAAPELYQVAQQLIQVVLGYRAVVGGLPESVVEILYRTEDLLSRIEQTVASLQSTFESDAVMKERSTQTTLATTGIDLIAAERAGHAVRGYDADADDWTHANGGLLTMAQQLLVANHPETGGAPLTDDTDSWGIARHHKGDPVTQLAIAGSLVAAEIDRRLRECAKTQADSSTVESTEGLLQLSTHTKELLRASLLAYYCLQDRENTTRTYTRLETAIQGIIGTSNITGWLREHPEFLETGAL